MFGSQTAPNRICIRFFSLLDPVAEQDDRYGESADLNCVFSVHDYWPKATAKMEIGYNIVESDNY